MNALRIALGTARSFRLHTADCNDLIHGLIHDCWRENMEFAHGMGFGRRGNLKLYTYGQLEGNLRRDRARHTIDVDGVVRFEVRSPLDELIDELAERLLARRSAWIGDHELQVVDLECADRLLFPTPALISTRSPILALHTVHEERRHKKPIGPADEGWEGIIRANLREKAYALGLDETLVDEMRMEVRPESLRPRRRRYQKGAFLGWDATLMVACSEDLLRVIYNCGLGSKNSGGFGMVSIIDRLPRA